MSTFPIQIGLRCCLAFAFLVSAAANARNDDQADLRVALAAERTRAPAPRFERDALMVRASIAGVTLSPDGRQVAYLKTNGRAHSVWLLATPGGKPRRLLQRTDATQIYWSRDSRWLLLESPRQIFALAVAGQAGSGIVSSLGGREERQAQRVDPGSAAAVILIEHSPGLASTARYWRLWRAEVGGKQTLLHENANKIVDFAFDPQGRLAFLTLVEGDEVTIYRVNTDGKLRRTKRLQPLRRAALLYASADGNAVTLRGDLSANLSGLQTMDSAGAPRTLHTDPLGEADLDELVLDPISQQPLIASYRSTTSRNYGLTAEARRHVDAINAAFPNRDLRISVGIGEQAWWLVRESASTLQGDHWHLYDPRSGSFLAIFEDAVPLTADDKPTQWLPSSSLARQIPFTYRASDGMRLHGFLWVPTGAALDKTPLVANVHGGPWSATRPGFSSLPQLLANHGYVVFEPNYRGSTHLGRDYLQAARGDLGNGRVQQDIIDGVRYLLAQGVGDGDRVGITGGSFGGYSTLLALTFAPELFKVGVAAVPPPDLSWDMRWVSRNEESLNLSKLVPFESWLRMSSLDLNDKQAMDRLHQQSPLANAGAMNRPLLIVAGGEDRRVDIASVIEYAARLKLMHKDVSLLIESDAGHSVSGPDARSAYMYLLERMLHRHLGGQPPTAPNNRELAYIDENMRITGHGLKDPGTSP